MRRFAIGKPVRLPPRSKVEVRIGSEKWRRVGDLRLYGPQDRVYAIRHAPDGRTQIVFGDGRRGKVPPKGALISVTYRRGDGTSISLERKSLSRSKNIALYKD
jgi:hypothetical protein